MNKFYSLASSSSGNCYIYQFNDAIIMIDCGISYKQLVEKLMQINLTIDNIDALIITHEHIDHVKALKMLRKKHSIPLFISPELANILEIEEYNNIFVIDNINNIKLEVIKTSHDAIDPIGIILEDDMKLVHITDTGYLNKKNLVKINNAHFYTFESNYDDEMIIVNDKYPLQTKQRIMGEKGHLSNHDANYYLQNIIGNNTKCVCFAHLSENNNTKQLVEAAHKNLTVEKHILDKTEIVEVCFDAKN